MVNRVKDCNESYNIRDNMPVPENGVDIYLYMDYSFGQCVGPTLVCFGEPISTSRPIKMREWAIKAYPEVARALTDALNLKDNRLSVTVCGLEQYIMAELMNNRSKLRNCITPDNFF